MKGKNPQYDTVECGARIKQLRKEAGYTQDELAERLGINRSFLSRIEAGQKGCSVDMFILLSVLLDITLDALILGRSLDDHPLKQDVHSLIEHLKAFEKLL